jgi:hypothetical protein
LRPENIKLPANTVSISIPLDAAYERLLRWYPAQWRRENGPAMVGALLDQADADNRSVPSFSDRVSLTVGGIRQRLLLGVHTSGLRLIPLAAAAALSVFYLFITWSPGLSYPGTLGPFSNPSVIAAVLLIVAFPLALFARTRAAQALTLAAVAVEIVVGILSARENWFGPSWTTVALFVGLALLGMGPARSRRVLVLGLLAIVGVVAAAIFGPHLVALVGELLVSVNPDCAEIASVAYCR